MIDEDDIFAIPEEWPVARVYLERSLEARRIRLERRDDAIEEQIRGLSVKVAETQMQIEGIREGVSHLNESFRHVSEQNALLVNMIGADTIEQANRWDKYEKEQREQGKVLRDGYAIVSKEDADRTTWRVIYLGVALVILVAIFAVKAA